MLLSEFLQFVVFPPLLFLPPPPLPAPNENIQDTKHGTSGAFRRARQHPTEARKQNNRKKNVLVILISFK
jgi:hypothetical protein